MDTKTLLRNRRSAAAYRRRKRDAGAPTSRDAAAVILEAFVDAAARAGAEAPTRVVNALVERGFDAEASAALVSALVARRAAELSGRRC